MEINRSLEEKLWSITRPNPIDRQSFVEVIDYLFHRLSDYLQQPLEVIGQDAVREDSFCRSFRGTITPVEAFKITFVGVLGMELIGDSFEPHTSANLYLFGDHHRLTAGAPNRSYIYLDYARGQNNIGQWVSRGWDVDEFDEYEDIDEQSYI